MFVVVPASGMLLVLGMLVYVYSQLELPETPPPLQTTYIYDRDGTQIATLHAGVDRTIIPLSEMPKTLQHAVIAVEDNDFYQHPGIDPIGIVRAAWTDLVTGEVVQGGSTITQQLVKNVYAGQYVEDPMTNQQTYVIPPRTLGQKIRESLLAIKVEQEFTKDEILEKYLNTVYFGHGAYGVQAAAQTYCQKDASELTDLESAMLAGLIQSPSTYDPTTTRTARSVRRGTTSWTAWSPRGTSRERAAAMKDVPVTTNAIEVGLHFPGKLGYFLDYTRRVAHRPVRRVGGVRRRPAGHHDARPRHAARRRAGGRDPARHAGRPGRGARRDRPAHGRRPWRCTAGRTSTSDR